MIVYQEYGKDKKKSNAVTTPGGMLIGMLEDLNGIRIIQIKRDGKMEYVDVEFIKKQLDKPLM